MLWKIACTYEKQCSDRLTTHMNEGKVFESFNMQIQFYIFSGCFGTSLYNFHIVLLAHNRKKKFQENLLIFTNLVVFHLSQIAARSEEENFLACKFIGRIREQINFPNTAQEGITCFGKDVHGSRENCKVEKEMKSNVSRFFEEHKTTLEIFRTNLEGFLSDLKSETWTEWRKIFTRKKFR